MGSCCGSLFADNEQLDTNIVHQYVSSIDEDALSSHSPSDDNFKNGDFLYH